MTIERPRITKEFEKFEVKAIRPSGAMKNIEKNYISRDVAIMVGAFIVLLILLTYGLARR